MPRDIPIGNGTLLVAFDRDYCLRDLYYPYVGKENHVNGHRFRFGIWVDGDFQWIDRERWRFHLGYDRDALSSKAVAENGDLDITLDCNDVVDHRENIYIRDVTVKNSSSRERSIRLFFHQDFHILESATGDTTYYDPDEKAVIHYKADRYFLISGFGEAPGVDQYATGVKEFHGLEGTWKDAEDGTLEGHPIAQGSVDSTVSFSVTVPPFGEETVCYWIAAGRDYEEVRRLNRMIRGHGPEYFMRRTVNYWRAWVNKEEFNLAALPQGIADLFKKSLLILRTNIDARGAILAANDSDIQHFARDSYSYMWPRDGALTAHALDMAGYLDVTSHFFDFCLDIIGKGKESVGYFLHKYNPDGSLGSSWHPWTLNNQRRLPIQEDGTGLVLWALWFHFDKFRDIEFAVRQYENVVIRCGDFLASYRDPATGLPLPSYDLWEEQWGIHTYTASCVHAGLRAARNFSNLFGDAKRVAIYSAAADEVKRGMETQLFNRNQGRFLKSVVPFPDGSIVGDLTVDASMYAPFYFNVFEPDDERVVGTMRAIEERLTVNAGVGGIARYEGDLYQRPADRNEAVPGNPWFICTLWLAQWHIARAKEPSDLRSALSLLEWAISKALPSGVLAEQVDPFTGQPLSVSPLTWSHATFVTTVLEYLDRLGKTDACPACGSPMHTYGRGRK